MHCTLRGYVLTESGQRKHAKGNKHDKYPAKKTSKGKRINKERKIKADREREAAIIARLEHSVI